MGAARVPSGGEEVVPPRERKNEGNCLAWQAYPGRSLGWQLPRMGNTYGAAEVLGSFRFPSSRSVLITLSNGSSANTTTPAAAADWPGASVPK
jgi:hypothetical protein